MFPRPGQVFRPSCVPALSLLVVFLCLQTARAIQCPIIRPRPVTPADQAFLSGDYAKAETLYRDELKQHPHQRESQAGLIHALLRQQKLDEAFQLAGAAVTAEPNTAELLTLRGEVEYRRGLPWDATRSANDSTMLDPCNPRNFLLVARIATLNSQYATAQKSILLAHQLDPGDPEIKRAYINTLPRTERMQQLEEYLAKPQGLSADQIQRLKAYLEHLHKLDTESHKPCRLVSTATSTEIPFVHLMYDANHIRAFGLNVRLNNRSARLEIDTGAGGLVVSRSIAQHGGLKPVSQTQLAGIGDEGDKAGYTAYADSIRIGNLEFENCLVEVLDSRHGLDDVDGVIGMDVFSRFLVTLDYPMQKLVLGPLPPRPGATTGNPEDLDTEDEEPAESKEQPQTPGNRDTSGTVDHSPDRPMANSAPETNTARGPYDRYVAPGMQDYTSVYRIGHDLILPASINGKDLKLFILDTGAWSTTISPDAAREVTKVHRDWDADIRGVSGKVANVYTASSVTFRFAHLSQKANDLTSFDTSAVSKDLGLEISGFIGANTLHLLTMHIDYRDGLVKFDYDPNRGYHTGN